LTLNDGSNGAFSYRYHTTAKARQAIENEIMVHSVVGNHPNIIRLLNIVNQGSVDDSGTATADACLIVEYADQGSLEDVLNGGDTSTGNPPRRRLSEEDTRAVFRQLLAGLVHLHSCGFA